MVFRVSLNNGIVKNYQIRSFSILPSPPNAPIVLQAHGMDKMIDLNLSSNLVPDKLFFEKIEIIPDQTSSGSDRT
jgi:hypothetical protein